MAGFLWPLADNSREGQRCKERVKFRSPHSKPGRRAWCLGPVVAAEELRGVDSGWLLEDSLKGLGEEWERKQAVKDVSRFFLEKPKSK